MPEKLSTLKEFSDDKGNSLLVGKGCKFEKSTLMFRESGAKVKIGNNVNFYNCDIRLGVNAYLTIGCDSQIDGDVHIGMSSSIVIGKSVTVTKRLLLKAVENTSITIGDDCIIASNVTIRTNGGHLINDAKTRARINLSKSIIIEEHVWLCDECMLLKGVTVGQASVIAARSIVTQNVDRNSIYAGIPARKVRDGITWERDIHTRTDRFYLLG